MKLKDEEKKDKKRSPFLPWTKGKTVLMCTKSSTIRLRQQN